MNALNKMVRLSLLLGFGLLLMSANNYPSQESEVLPVEVEASVENVEGSQLTISGFGDLIFHTNGLDGFTINQVELGIGNSIGDFVSVETAIAFDPDSETFGLGAFIIDLRLFGNEGDHLRVKNGIDHSGILIGQFDIPFGLDWQVYPSVDRKLISTPIVVEESHNAWNDHGILGYVENQRFNAVAFRTNGFGYEIEPASGDPVSIELDYSLGGRLGLFLGHSVEVGFSGAGFFNDENQVDMNLQGFDLQFEYRLFELRGEYIIKEFNLIENVTHTCSGYYVEGLVDRGNYFLNARYDHFSEGDLHSENIRRLSTGIGWPLAKGLELRLVYQSSLEASESGGFLQLVPSF